MIEGIWESLDRSIVCYSCQLIILVAAPGIPLLLTWRQMFRPRCGKKKRAVLLAITLTIATVSYLWLMAGLVHGNIIGPNYSTWRFVVIGLNCAADMVGAVAAICIRDIRKPLLIVGLCAVGLEWFYAGVVSSAV
ncbi:MAG TPA: hypothetical protein VFB76_07825 [Candidatus Angelobacter sp.]|nr:hypothetical protein [Candidatus Angelobacter sp.]